MKVCVLLVDRANYGRLLPVMEAIAECEQLTLQVVCAGTMSLPRFGRCVDLVRSDGFAVDAELCHEHEGNSHLAMACACGSGMPLFAHTLERLRPDMLLMIGDRYEALGAAAAAHLMNIPIMHFQGGETSECVDHRTRNAITAMATWHVPATEAAALAVGRMTGKPDGIVAVGCPASDLAAEVFADLDEDGQPSGPLLVSFHPNTTEHADKRTQMRALLNAIKDVPHEVDLLWPNIDPGSDEIHQETRTFLKKPRDWLRTYKNLAPRDYMAKLANTRCAIGNSSSFVRDSTFFGTPVVLVGSRQNGRETGANVMQTSCDAANIRACIESQLSVGRTTEPSSLYGDGTVSEQVVSFLLNGVRQ